MLDGALMWGYGLGGGLGGEDRGLLRIFNVG